jgi:peptidoglycan/xylan/chitin deacetylase (PgdA/CDA1 family)
VLKYPDVARRVADEGHEIGNHSFDHHVLLYYTPQEVEAEIRKAEEAIFKATGKTTRYFRPPKAWLTDDEKKKIGLMGYGVVLWSLNSKDWVGFDDKVIVRYISGNVRPGDIILFHDSGGALAVEGGDRHQTVQSVSRLERTLRQKGYSFVTVSELLAARQKP